MQGLRSWLQMRKSDWAGQNYANTLLCLSQVITYHMDELGKANSSKFIEVLGRKSGIQTYLSCAITRDSPRVVFYLSTKIYSK